MKKTFLSFVVSFFIFHTYALPVFSMESSGSEEAEESEFHRFTQARRRQQERLDKMGPAIELISLSSRISVLRTEESSERLGEQKVFDESTAILTELRRLREENSAFLQLDVDGYRGMSSNTPNPITELDGRCVDLYRRIITLQVEKKLLGEQVAIEGNKYLEAALLSSREREIEVLRKYTGTLEEMTALQKELAGLRERCARMEGSQLHTESEKASGTIPVVELVEDDEEEGYHSDTGVRGGPSTSAPRRQDPVERFVSRQQGTEEDMESLGGPSTSASRRQGPVERFVPRQQGTEEDMESLAQRFSLISPDRLADTFNFVGSQYLSEGSAVVIEMFLTFSDREGNSYRYLREYLSNIVYYPEQNKGECKRFIDLEFMLNERLLFLLNRIDNDLSIGSSEVDIFKTPKGNEETELARVFIRFYRVFFARRVAFLEDLYKSFGQRKPVLPYVFLNYDRSSEENKKIKEMATMVQNLSRLLNDIKTSYLELSMPRDIERVYNHNVRFELPRGMGDRYRVTGQAVNGWVSSDIYLRNLEQNLLKLTHVETSSFASFVRKRG